MVSLYMYELVRNYVMFGGACNNYNRFIQKNVELIVSKSNIKKVVIKLYNINKLIEYTVVWDLINNIFSHTKNRIIAKRKSIISKSIMSMRNTIYSFYLDIWYFHSLPDDTLLHPADHATFCTSKVKFLGCEN